MGRFPVSHGLSDFGVSFGELRANGSVRLIMGSYSRDLLQEFVHSQTAISVCYGCKSLQFCWLIYIDRYFTRVSIG